jgi:hypothetical protein
VDDVEHQCGHFRQEDTNALQGITFRAGEYVTRRVGATEPIDPVKVYMKMQISSCTPADISFPAPSIVHGLVGRSSSATDQGLAERLEVLVLWI